MFFRAPKRNHQIATGDSFYIFSMLYIDDHLAIHKMSSSVFIRYKNYVFKIKTYSCGVISVQIIQDISVNYIR